MTNWISRLGRTIRFCRKPIPRPVGGIHPTEVLSRRFSPERLFPMTPVRSTFEIIGLLRRLFVLPPITIDYITQVLAQYVRESGSHLNLILVGGLGLQAYGFADRVTVDVDGELTGDLDPLVAFLWERHVPSDLGENMSGRSVVAMPPGYRERSTVFYQDAGLCLRLLAPTDFVIAKLRRGIDQDLKDAEFVVRQFHVASTDIQVAAGQALAASPKDTALFLF